MNFDPSLQLPATFDIAHLALAGVALIMLIAFFLKSPKNLITPASLQDSANLHDGANDPSTDPVVGIDKPKTRESSQDSVMKTTSSDSALQFLSLLQQEARIIDFVHENISDYTDEEVGAAARVVHEGSLKALSEYFTLIPIREEEEESRITLAEGFNASEVRLTGNVVGSAPFSGILVHRGWRVKEVKLPRISEGHDVAIVAAAEVEL